MEKQNIIFKMDPNFETPEDMIVIKEYLTRFVDVKIRIAINGAISYFNLSSTQELLDGINTGNITIISKTDLKLGKDIIRLPHVSLVYTELLDVESDNGNVLKYLSQDKHKIYQTSLLTDELKIIGILDNIESIIKAKICKMIEEERQWN